jgi:bla regulator protein BlaR1
MIGAWTNHLWQSTVFAFAAGLLTVAFRKNRAPVRYWLWFSASFKFFVPFSLLMSLGSHLGWAPAAAKIATPTVSFTMVQITQPFSGAMPLAPSTRSTHDWVPIAIFGIWVCGFSGVALIRFRGFVSGPPSGQALRLTFRRQLRFALHRVCSSRAWWDCCAPSYSCQRESRSA